MFRPILIRHVLAIVCVDESRESQNILSVMNNAVQILLGNSTSTEIISGSDAEPNDMLHPIFK